MIKVFAPAKVNLFLRVLGKREDGYHDVETVLQAISLFDTIIIEEAKRLSVNTSPFSIPEKDNLVYKAALLLKEELNIKEGARISIMKRIPLSSGLGGGSSDAAGVLLGLLRLWNKDLSPFKLHSLACSLGADVPFFLKGGTAFGKNKGTELSFLPSAQFYIVLVHLPFFISSSFAYEKVKIKLTDSEDGIKMMLSAIENKDIRRVSSYLFNALEEEMEKLYPQIQKAKHALKEAGALGVLMSGSGPTVFGIAEKKEHALLIKKKLSSLGYNIRVVYTIDGGVKIRWGVAKR